MKQKTCTRIETVFVETKGGIHGMRGVHEARGKVVRKLIQEVPFDMEAFM